MAPICIVDLKRSGPAVPRLLSSRGLKLRLTREKVKKWQDLNCWDLRVFENASQADTFCRAYNQIRNDLNNEWMCKSREFPCMLYKRRYMILTLLGLKNYTVRDYLWERVRVGDKFNLYDQIFFLTVTLLSVTKIGRNEWRYEFKIS